jgi:hypothetical protein
MERYYVNDNAQNSGDHEVHKDGCYYLSLAKSTTYLGYHSSCKTAVTEAKKYYSQSDGCAFCSPDCNKG